MAEAHLIADRVDTIIETTAPNPAYFAEQVARYRSAGYRVEAAILAVPEAASRLGVVHRYHDQVQQARPRPIRPAAALRQPLWLEHDNPGPLGARRR
jgi:hypothetical protein